MRSVGSGSLFKKGGAGPWIASYFDHAGKRRERSTRTTDRRAAERILAKIVADVALRREGVIDPRDDRFATEARRPLTEHIAAYIANCRGAGHNERFVKQKEQHFARITEATGATRLVDIDADSIGRYLAGMKERGRSARTRNAVRALCIAFMGWCVRTGRVESNPLGTLAKVDEERDRRRVRRPLTDDELARLLAVARERGRDSWYLAAALAGLRRGDLHRLEWRDIDFKTGTITIREGKARRADVLPMHEQLAEALRRRLDARPAMPTARVWPEAVTDLTRAKDFLRAGLARRVPVLDADGNPIKIGAGKRERIKTRLVTHDDEGRVIDLHALRTTLGTQLARAGVAPQVAQRVMRHADYKTTLRHYTVLGLVDTASAVAKLPGVRPTREAAQATGTHGAIGFEHPQQNPQQKCQQLGHRVVQNGSVSCTQLGMVGMDANIKKPRLNTGFCEDSSGKIGKAGEGIRTLDVQLGRLSLYH
jgi:integrase